MHAAAFPMHDLQSEVSYDPWTAYGNSKFANLLFTYELNHRLEVSGNPKAIKAIAVHPGYTATNLQTDRFPLYDFFNSLLAMHGEDGAKSQVYAAVDPKVQASDRTYIGPAWIMFGAPKVQSTKSSAWVKERQEKLWQESERLTGMQFVLGGGSEQL